MKKLVAPAAAIRVKDWLQTASRWRLLSLLFQFPSRRTRNELRRLAEEAPAEVAALADEWAGISMQLAEADYHRVLGPGGVPAVESSYDPNALAGRGPLLADIAAFHKAFSYAPEHPPAEVPDHIATELDFLSYLAFKAAFATESGGTRNAGITIKAYRSFLHDHLFNWVGAFQERLDQSGPSIYAYAARHLQPGRDAK